MSGSPSLKGEMHEVSFGGRRLVLDVGTSTTFEVDDSGGEVLRPLRELPRAGALVVDVDAFLAHGSFQPDTLPTVSEAYVARRYTVKLALTYRCSLACHYCGRGEAASHRGVPQDMPRDVLDAAVEWGVQNFAREAPDVRFTAGVAGDAYLYPDGLNRFRERARQLGEATGKRISAGVGTTNLTLASQPHVWEQMRDDWWSVSIDGPPEVHDAMRPFADGRGSYEAIAPFAQYLAREKRCGACPVITSQQPNLTEIFLHIFDMGFRWIELRPVVASPDNPFAINPETVGAVKEGFTAWLEFMLAEDDDNRLLEYLRAMWHMDDFLGRFLLRILRHQKTLYRCQAGKNEVFVDTSGDIYPCSHLAGQPELRMGDVFSGLEEGVQRPYYEDLLVTRKPGCRDCWARYLCGGGCCAAGYLATGRIDTPAPADCELMRHLIELAMYGCARLLEERPRVVAALPEHPRTMIDPSSVVPCYAASESLATAGPTSGWESPHPIRFDRGEQMKGRIWEGPEALSGGLHLRWDSSNLYLLGDFRIRRPSAKGITALLDVYVAAPEDAVAGNLEKWWTQSVPHHRITFSPHAPRATISTESMPGEAPGIVEVPADVQLRDGRVLVRAGIPWSRLPLLQPEYGALFGINATLCPDESWDRNQCGMRWLPGSALGLLRLDRRAPRGGAQHCGPQAPGAGEPPAS
jgi:uncharacterized protein